MDISLLILIRLIKWAILEHHRSIGGKVDRNIQNW